MQEALEVLVGPDAKGLSPSVIGRLKRVWEAEYAEWCRRDVGKDRWVYLWADGLYSGLRADQQKLCVLVVIGVNERGEKRFLAIEEGVRESAQSWREMLLDLKRRGLTVPRNWRWETMLWGSGRRWMRCILKPVTSAVGCTRRRTC